MLQHIKDFFTGTRRLLGIIYIKLMPFRHLGQLSAIIAILASGGLTATVTFTALTALFGAVMVMFPVLAPAITVSYIISGIAALALGVKAGYEASKFLWQKAAIWGQKLDSKIIKFLTGDPYYLTTIEQNINKAKKTIFKIEDSLNYIEILLTRYDDYLKPSPVKHPDTTRKRVINVLERHINALSDWDGLTTDEKNNIAEELKNAERLIMQAKQKLRAKNNYFPDKKAIEHNLAVPVKELSDKIKELNIKLYAIKQQLENKLNAIKQKDDVKKVNDVKVNTPICIPIKQRLETISTITTNIQEAFEHNAIKNSLALNLTVNNCLELVNSYQNNNHLTPLEYKNLINYTSDLKRYIMNYQLYINRELENNRVNINFEQQEKITALLTYLMKNYQRLKGMVETMLGIKIESKQTSSTGKLLEQNRIFRREKPAKSKLQPVSAYEPDNLQQTISGRASL